MPVCCDADLAPDLERLAEAKGMEPAQVIALLTAATYRVYMIGFMPGFPYMGAATATGHAAPGQSAQVVPARSLAVTGEMCAVYPWESPGGWNLLGRTPVPLFEAAEETAPALLESGDQVRWRVVDRAEYEHIAGELAAGRLSRANFHIAGEAA